jgi:polyphosphate kinase
VHGLDRPDLKDPPYQRVTPTRLSKGEGERADVFAAMRQGDLLVHHPYESFRTTVEEFVRQAAVDPQVLAIKMTLYRTSGDSPIVRALIRAADRGKQVAVIVELKARFDEGANIEWARLLETAGVHVTYGLIGLKVHSKALLVVREEADGLRRYCHVGTGNYNSRTARIYEDLGLLTCDPAIGGDLTQLFNELTGYGRNIDYQRLAVAPRLLRPALEALIEGEIEAAGEGPGRGRITMKMNSLVDEGMIELLYRASQAGVDVDLVVRGICCLIPGVPGLSENITVRSIVGRYLEHSRIYRFANGDGPDRPRYLIGSADLMPRNLNRRVEVLTPVGEPDLQARLDEILDVALRDDVLAWTLDADGQWTRCPPGGEVESHAELQRLTTERADRSATAIVV